jgi:hypothetical protein
MDKMNDTKAEPDETMRTIRDLEAALLDYIRRYGLTDKARRALDHMGKVKGR